MRYQEVCSRFEQLLDARSECSREWTISESVVMCAEFDIASAVRVSLAVPGHTEPRHLAIAHRLVRVMFFDRAASRIEHGAMTPLEHDRVAEVQQQIEAWVSGVVDDLPPSTSSVISERFRTR